jgi:ATP-binding cassette subfamily B protein
MRIAPDIEEKKDAIHLRDMRGDVEFKVVDFSYDGSEFVLEKLNLKIKSGEKLTLVRPSRAGKSIVCSLIPRFYDVSSGSVAIVGCCRMITSLKKIKIYDTVQLKNKKRS